MTKITDDNSTEETETMNTTDNDTELHPLVRAARIGTYLKEVETLFNFINSNMGDMEIRQPYGSGIVIQTTTEKLGELIEKANSELELVISASASDFAKDPRDDLPF